ncbi:MAG: hypothetical protein M1818_004975 [Claussenomyces sp. TS43310]|nr:MAG: hypothetical protein M1818_004975 [Claussenomyces sp. TS43310]
MGCCCSSERSDSPAPRPVQASEGKSAKAKTPPPKPVSQPASSPPRTYSPTTKREQERDELARRARDLMEKEREVERRRKEGKMLAIVEQDRLNQSLADDSPRKREKRRYFSSSIVPQKPIADTLGDWEAEVADFGKFVDEVKSWQRRRTDPGESPSGPSGHPYR